jgi:DNA-3-methyladenine glycosylase II
MAFKCRPLHAAADTYLRCRDEWATMPADVLVKALQTVPRIGPWTAGAAVADHTGDFSVYPYGDLAVRTWARRADPATAWPDDDPGFAALWRALAGPHLSTLTALTLAWGDQRVHQPAHPRNPVH